VNQEEATQEPLLVEKKDEKEALSGIVEIGPATIKEFLRLLEQEFEPKPKFLWVDGKLFISLDLSAPHEAAVDEIKRQMGILTHALVISKGSANFNAPAGGGAAAFSALPDGSWRPRALVGPNPSPTMILEVGRSQTLADLHTKALRWLGANTTIQIVLVIKIWELFGGNNIRLLAMRYERGAVNPIFAVSFGTHRLHAATRATLANGILGATLLRGVGEVHPVTGIAYPACNGAGIPIYQLRIPNLLLYNGVPGGVPPAAPGIGYYTFDLFSVQTDVITSFQ